MHGENVQMWTEAEGSRGDSVPGGGLRTRCLRASHGAGRSRKMAFAFGDVVGVPAESFRRNPSW